MVDCCAAVYAGKLRWLTRRETHKHLGEISDYSCGLGLIPGKCEHLGKLVTGVA